MSQPNERRSAVAYVRVSSDEQVEGLSLTSQEDKIREWCDAKGFEIIAMFRDEGESAYNDDISKRPQFAALLDRLPDLKPDVVVVFSLDRWARSTVVSSQTFRLLAELHIGFASVTESIWDFSEPSSRLVLGFLASFAEYSSASTAQHVRRVNDLKFNRGSIEARSHSDSRLILSRRELTLVLRYQTRGSSRSSWSSFSGL